MFERIAAFVTGEGNWLPVAMVIALAVVATRWGGRDGRRRTQTAMNRFVGVTLLVMGVGHVLAVTVHVAGGTLRGAAAFLYIIGVAIVLPALLLIARSARANTTLPNAWLAATLVILGLINIPLAIPALLNIAYAKHANPRTGAAIAATWMLVVAGLFAGGMMFMLSGARTFEEFSSQGQ